MKNKRVLIVVLGVIVVIGLTLLATRSSRQNIPGASYLDSAIIGKPEIIAEYLEKILIARGVSIPMIDPHFLHTTAVHKNGRKSIEVNQILSVFSLDAPALAEFKAKLKPIPAPEYVPAQGPVSWWVSADDFPSLEFYDSAPMIKFDHGFIAISPSDNTVFMLGTN